MRANTLISSSVLGRARSPDETSEAEAYIQARLQALIIDARQHMNTARRDGDMERVADWQRNVEWTVRVLADHEETVYASRVAGEKLAAIPDPETGQSVSDE